MMYASEHCMIDRVRWLLARGARVNISSSPPSHPPSFFDSFLPSRPLSLARLQSNALMFASNSGHLEVVRLLIEQGASVNASAMATCEPRNRNEGLTALMLASAKGHLGVARELVARGASVSAELPNHTASTHWFLNQPTYTPLLWATENGHLEVIRELINFAEANGAFFALRCASYKGHLGIVRELINRGTNVNAVGENGSTTLMLACCFGHLEVARKLCGRGCDINAFNNYGSSALWISLQRGHDSPITKLLLQRGANDPNALLWIANRKLMHSVKVIICVATLSVSVCVCVM